MVNQSLNLSAIILAAGRSQRFGAPKVLQRFNGIPFLTKIKNNLQQAGLGEMILVLGHRAQELIPALPEAEDFKIVINERYDLGQLSSLQAGLKKVNPHAQGVMMCLVDQPHVPCSVYRALVRAFKQQANYFLIPEFKGRGGHPIVIPAKFFKEIIAANPRQLTLKDVIAAHPESVKRIALSEPAILEDIDVKEKLTELEQKYKD